MKKIILFLIIGSVSTATCWSCSLANKKNIVVEGIVMLTGNEPFTHLLLTGEKGSYILQGKNSELMRVQNRRARVIGKFNNEKQELINSKGTIEVKTFEILP